MGRIMAQGQAPAVAPQKTKMPGFAKLVIVLLAALPVAALIGFLGTQAGSTPDPASLRFQAQRACEGAVEQNLKAPASAEYDSQVGGGGEGPWAVTGTVDAQNSFGAMIRSTYSCSVELKNGVVSATLKTLVGP